MRHRRQPDQFAPQTRHGGGGFPPVCSRRRESAHISFRTPRSALRIPSAFTRADLLVTLGTLMLLSTAFIAGCKGASEKGRIAGCAGSLTTLGKAIHAYAKDHDDALPWGSIHYSQQRQVAWDTQLKPYLMNEASKTNSALAAKTRDRALVKMLVCPSDVFPRGGTAKPRSYSMARHDMTVKNWPPGPDNTTGVGLNWSFGPQGAKPPPARTYNFSNANAQAVIKLGMIPEPKDTLLLTEQIQSNNVVWTTGRALVATTGAQLATNLVPAAQFHEGRFNYLMVDGHVEFLTPKQTVGHKGEAGTNAMKHLGIWTIKPGD